MTLCVCFSMCVFTYVWECVYDCENTGSSWNVYSF